MEYPHPQKDEKRHEFLHRCKRCQKMKKAFPGRKRRSWECFKLWRKHKILLHKEGEKIYNNN